MYTTNGHTQMQNHNDSTRHINIMRHQGLVQSNDKMKLIIKEYDYFVHSLDGTSIIWIYLKIVWMDVHYLHLIFPVFLIFTICLFTYELICCFFATWWNNISDTMTKENVHWYSRSCVRAIVNVQKVLDFESVRKFFDQDIELSLSL